MLVFEVLINLVFAYLEANVDGKLPIMVSKCRTTTKFCLPLSTVMNKLLQVQMDTVSLSRISLFLLVLYTFRYCITENRHAVSCAYTVSDFYLILVVTPESVTWDLCIVNSC